MEIPFYENLKQSFINIRILCTDGYYNELLYNKTISDLRLAEATLAVQNQTIDTRILLYCIETLFEIISENNKEKLYDFADTIYNMPELAYTNRQFKSFRREINAFRKKYGRAYFSDFADILTNGIITPLSVGLFYIISPIPLLISDILFCWILFFDIGWKLFGGPENIPDWYNTLTILPTFIYPIFPIAGIIYGIVMRKEKNGKLCITLSSIGFLINILIFALILYMGLVG
ncbi:MAG: hypothetical protein UE295_04580 [Acutalibacteraceae bacterium]|nr:hypothetical protein [Acutalibacteraceae bacterium]